MAVAEIIHFTAESVDPDNLIRKTAQAAGQAKNITFGTQVQEPVTVQILSEWEDRDTPEHNSFTSRVSSSGGEIQSIYHVSLNRSAFGTDGPATGKVVEYVKNFFPVSRVTPEFQRQVEEDFLRFNDIYVEGVQTDTSVAFGWVLEEQEHEDVKGETTKCFFICRGWESMYRFEQSLKTEAYQKAIPILFGWNTPFKMVSSAILHNVIITS
jgi:hypothetical protein